jgi:hypothetical protein
MQHDMFIYILIMYMTNIMVREVAGFCGVENLCYRSLAYMLWCPRNTGAMEREIFRHRNIGLLEISQSLFPYISFQTEFFQTCESLS